MACSHTTGTSHFRTTIREGINLMRALRVMLPAMPMPSYVLDLPGGFSKVNLESENAVETQPNQWRLLDEAGRWHDYEG
jgi:lysine 2,3-aminomutase